MKKYLKIFKYSSALISAVIMLFGCTSTNNTANSISRFNLEEIIAGARDEGSINSVAMPDDWANFGDTWRDIRLFYKIETNDTNMSSAEELETFDGDEGSADIGDAGFDYAKEAESRGLTMKYKTSYWDDIPSWAKDNDGDWVVCYTGTLAFLINDEVVDKPPTSWHDVLEGDYKVGIGDVINSSMAQYAIYAAAVAMGGSSEDIKPGIQFFKTLAEQGRLETNLITFDDFIDSGVGVQMKWDFVALNYRDKALEGSKPIKLSACLPSDGSVTMGYASIINKKSANPFAAALVREYILSDAGQLNLVRGYATPIRSINIPEEMVAKRIPKEQYTDEMTVNALNFKYETIEKITAEWKDEVIPVLVDNEGSKRD